MEANRIRYYRLKSNLSKNTLAIKAGITANIINDIEKGKLAATPSLRNDLASLLGVDEVELFPQKALDLILS